MKSKHTLGRMLVRTLQKKKKKKKNNSNKKRFLLMKNLPLAFPFSLDQDVLNHKNRRPPIKTWGLFFLWFFS